MDSQTFTPGRQTMHGIYSSASSPGGSANEDVNVKPRSGGRGLQSLLKDTGHEATTFTGLSLPALAVLGLMAWWLFRRY